MEDKERVSVNRLKFIRSLLRVFGIAVFFVLYIPPLLSMYFSKNRKEIIMDIKANRTYKTNFTALSFLDLFIYNKYFRVLFYHRIAVGISFILRVLYPGNNTFFIEYKTKIGGGLKLSHPYSTIINAENIVTNCQIRQCTTIGNKDNDDQKPNIGD